VQAERRAAQAEREHEAAAAERTAAERDLAAVQSELGARTGEENDVRGRLTAERLAVRELEEALQRRAEMARSLEIEGGALDRERSELREQLALATAERHDCESAAQAAARDADAAYSGSTAMRTRQCARSKRCSTRAATSPRCTSRK